MCHALKGPNKQSKCYSISSTKAPTTAPITAPLAITTLVDVPVLDDWFGVGSEDELLIGSWNELVVGSAAPCD